MRSCWGLGVVRTRQISVVTNTPLQQDETQENHRRTRCAVVGVSRGSSGSNPPLNDQNAHVITRCNDDFAPEFATEPTNLETPSANEIVMITKRMADSPLRSAPLSGVSREATVRRRGRASIVALSGASDRAAAGCLRRGNRCRCSRRASARRTACWARSDRGR